MPPNPNATNPLPTGAHPIGELHPQKANEATPTWCKLHTQPHSKHVRPTQMQALGKHRHMHPHRQTNRNHQGHPADHHAKGKDASPERAPQKGHSTRSKEVALPPETQNHQHPGQPSKNDIAKPSQATVPPEPTPQQHRTSVREQ
ncbi:hypothetical protein AMECASPLE_032288 [Ameca splendens]|uniref:Uncharacterized protein n=1 Tax=Ameca splendens TaxID=208324 RepID=A0ABV0Z4R4_9TELE